MEQVLELVLSFPDFKLGEIIDPEEFDSNNADIVDKLNTVIQGLNRLNSNGGISTEHLADGCVVTAKLGDGSVVTSKLVDGSVTDLKLAPNSVGTNALKDQSVTGTKIKYFTITGDNVAANSIGLDKLIRADLDGRYPTRTDFNGSLGLKTDKTGDHTGTWQGLSPSDFDPNGAVLELDGIRQQVNFHETNKSNPHEVKWNQIGLTNYDALSSISAYSTLHTSVDLNSIDDNGTYKVVNFYMGSQLFKRHTLSSPNQDGLYGVLRIDFYDAANTLALTKNYSLSYDSNGTLTTMVVI